MTDNTAEALREIFKRDGNEKWFPEKNERFIAAILEVLLPERQQSPCHHEFGPRPIHDLPEAPSEAICMKCGYRPTATDGGHS